VDPPAISVEGTEAGEVVDVGPVAGGQDDRLIERVVDQRRPVAYLAEDDA